MNYRELLEKRRSVRNYTEKKVPLKIIRELIQDACLAPSACNVQPWHFIVIQNSEVVNDISEESKKNLLLDIKNNPDSLFKKFQDQLERSDFNVFYNANSLVLICGNKKNALALHENCALAASYFMLAATERGLATCWIGLGTKIVDHKLRQKIGLSPDLEIIAPLTIGYARDLPPVPERSAKFIKEIL